MRGTTPEAACLYEKCPFVVSRRRLLTASYCFAVAALTPRLSWSAGEIGDVARTMGSIKLMRAGQTSLAQSGTAIFSGDAVETGTDSKAQFRLAGANALSLAADSKLTFLKDEKVDGISGLVLRLDSGLAKVEQGDWNPDPIILHGPNALTWAVATPSTWFVRATRRGSEVVTAQGRIILSHDRQFWRMILNEGVGLPLVPDKDVPKHRLPKPRAYSALRISRLNEASAL